MTDATKRETKAPFRHVLVPLDGSPEAETALGAAATLAARLGARVTVLHVLERKPPTHVHGMAHLTDAAAAEAYLARQVAWLEERGIEAAAHVHTPGTGPAPGIVDHAVELDADLVALCPHGGGGWRGWLFGRVSNRVIGKADVAVLSVPPRTEGRGWELGVRHLLVALDGTPGAEAALAAACDLAEVCGARLLLWRDVATPGTLSGARQATARLLPRAASALLDAETNAARNYLAGVAAGLEAHGDAADMIVSRGEPIGGLLQVAADRDVDVAVVATSRRAGRAMLWNESFAARLIERGELPVLLVRRADEEETPRGRVTVSAETC